MAEQGDFSAAEAEFKKALSAEPKDSASQSCLGVLDDLKAGRISSECARSFFRGLSLFAQGLSEEALTEFKRTCVLEPDYAKTYNLMGIVFASLKNTQEATASFRKAIEIDSAYAKAHYNLALLYQAQGSYRMAIESYLQALPGESDPFELYSNLAASYAAVEEYAEAIEYYKKAVSLRPSDAATRYNLGSSYFMSGQYLKSKENFQKAKEFFLKDGDDEGAQEAEKYLAKFLDLEDKWRSSK